MAPFDFAQGGPFDFAQDRPFDSAQGRPSTPLTPRQTRGDAEQRRRVRPGRPRVGISRCLLGDDVRYDGGHKRDTLLLESVGPHVEWVPVCPEVEVGMSTPREPIHLVAARDGVASGDHRVRLVGVASGRDWTVAIDRWRRARIRELVEEGLSGYVLKQDSPSCGMEGVRIHSDEGIVRTGRGLFAQALLDAMPDLPVEEGGRLHDYRVRDDFLERVFAYHRDLCVRDRT